MRAITRLLARRRRLITAVLAGLAVACALLSIRTSHGVAVLAAAHDLPGGRLSAGDVTVVRLPPGAVPDGAFRRGSVLTDRVVTGPMRRGEPFTDARLLSRGLLTAPGLVATPVRIIDPGVAGLLSPGDIIDVFAADEHAMSQARVVAHQVRVMALPVTGQADEGALLVLATTPTQAAQLAQAQATSRLAVAIHPR